MRDTIKTTAARPAASSGGLLVAVALAFICGACLPEEPETLLPTGVLRGRPPKRDHSTAASFFTVFDRVYPCGVSHVFVDNLDDPCRVKSSLCIFTRQTQRSDIDQHQVVVCTARNYPQPA